MQPHSDDLSKNESDASASRTKNISSKAINYRLKNKSEKTLKKSCRIRK
jgi:hypothetical protein